MRVLTYNIHHGEGRDGQLDLARTADVIRGARPDIVALQEVDRHTARTDGLDELTELARMLDMHAEFGRAMDYQGGGYGVAILSRWPIASSENRALPHTDNHEPRTALTVRIRIGKDGPWVRVTSTHLDETRDPEVRLAQAGRLNELLLPETDHPSILAGDFNARLETDVMQRLDSVWSNAIPEYPQQPGPPPGAAQPQGSQGAVQQGAAQPGAIQPGSPPPQGALGPDGRPFQQRRGGPRGDFVLYRPAGAWRVVESRAIDDFVASDHRPVLTVLEWTGQG